ncbi:MAG TPA: hypothetical protein VE134_08850 [Methanomicrobiales archaeon]|nr:hypothetical protein [Methanomicrobiales archaeon]
MRETSPLFDFFKEIEENERGARLPIAIPMASSAVREIDMRPLVDLTNVDKCARLTARGGAPLGRFEPLDPPLWWEKLEDIARIQRGDNRDDLDGQE